MVLLLARQKPLTQAEIRALPAGCAATEGRDGIVARAELDLPVAQLLGFAVSMGRAVPDAIFVARDGDPQAAAAEVEEEAVIEHDPWRLVETGRLADADRVFAGLGEALSGPARDRVRGLFSDPDPARAALGCRVARYARLRSATVTLRDLLGHAHPDVRTAAIEALSELAGPSVAPSVARLQNDPDATVRAAATAALARW